jgi:hypothetical protein
MRAGQASTASRNRGRCGDLKVPTRYRRMPNGADWCRWLQTGASWPLQAVWLCAGRPRVPPDYHGKEGVAGSSPAEGFGL